MVVSLQAVNTVAEIIEAVKSLSVEELEEFLMRLREVDLDDAWDRQIAADSHVGRLDKPWQLSLEDIKAERTVALDDVLNET